MIARLEGKKSQARIGDIREILAIIVDLAVEGSTLEDNSLGVAEGSVLDVLFTAAIKAHGKKKLQ